MRTAAIIILSLIAGAAAAYDDYDSDGNQIDPYGRPVGGVVTDQYGHPYVRLPDGGAVSGRDGTYLAPSGPDGYVDTRTGRYVPAR